jgi:hypothetical protein
MNFASIIRQMRVGNCQVVQSESTSAFVSKCDLATLQGASLGWSVPRVKTLGSGRVMLNTYLVDGNH